MSPAFIAARCRRLGIHVAALADHNTARNAPAFAEASREQHLHPLFGAEVTTAEELHVLALFDDPNAALAFGEWVYGRLPLVPCRPEAMGDQPVVNARDEIVDTVPLYLGSATDLPLTDLGAEIRRRGGLFIPSHVDRPVHSLTSQLGRIPDLPYDAVEVGPAYDPVADPLRLRGRWAMIRSSDAHHPGQIGCGWTLLSVSDLSVAEIRAAFRRLAVVQRRSPQAGLGPRIPPLR